MIRVEAAAEPATFEEQVRRPGLDAIAELVGEAPSRPRRGPRRQVVAARREDLPADSFPPFWRACLPDLCARYRRHCAYLALYLHPGTSTPTVDHFEPKVASWRLVYEWQNYRLSASLINGYKRDRAVPIDPFAVPPGTFALEFTELQVVAGPAAPVAATDLRAQVEETIRVLGLNQLECCKARREYVEAYRAGPPEGIALARLELRAPFVAQELRRQGLLVRGDT